MNKDVKFIIAVCILLGLFTYALIMLPEAAFLLVIACIAGWAVTEIINYTC
jgi:hypothetical protein